MSGTWTKTFEVSVPLERLWDAFTHAERGLVLRSGENRIVESDDGKLLRWSAEAPHLPERAEFSVVFESTENGARFTVTRCGFGEGEDADVFSESNALGWEEGFMDLVLFLETGVDVRRHYYGCSNSATGMAYREIPAGVEVLRTAPGGFAEAAGLQRGDVLVRMAGAPIYRRSDVWLLTVEHHAGTDVEVEFVRGRTLQRSRATLSPTSSRLVGE